MSRQTSPNRSLLSDDGAKTDKSQMSEIKAVLLEIQESIRILAKENVSRSTETKELFKTMAKLNPQLELTEEELSGNAPGASTSIGPKRRDKDATLRKTASHRTPDSSPEREAETVEERKERNYNDNLKPARYAVEYVRTLRGHDDVGVEEFIRSAQRARKRCSEPEELLDLIVNKKIIGEAERSIRGLEIYDYRELYQALRDNISAATSYELARAKLASTRQMPNENVRSYDKRFIEKYNELKYTIQNDASEDTSRTETRIALKLEERNVLKTYISGLRDEICLQVRSARPRTLRDARMEALEIETFLLERQRARPLQRTHAPPQSHNKPLQKPTHHSRQKPASDARQRQPDRNFNKVENQTLAQRIGLKCDICGKLGHTKNRCFSNQNFTRNSLNSRPPQRTNKITTEDTDSEEETLNEYYQPEADYGVADGNSGTLEEQEDILSIQDPQ